jgi:hypothetical protein
MSALRALVLKDLRLLWPLVVLTAALLASRGLDLAALGLFGAYLPIAAQLAAGFFVLALVQQDAPASLRFDWLTRPIPKLALLVAKLLLATLVVVAPAVLGAAVAGVREGAPPVEALLAGLATIRGPLVAAFALLVVGALTTTLVEAIGVLIGLFLLFVFVPPAARQVSGLTEAVLFLGSGWVLLCAFLFVGVAGGLAALWLQYRRRSTTQARAAFALTIAGFAALFTFVTWDTVFAVQVAAGPSDPAAARFSLVRGPECFAAKRLESSPGADDPKGLWSTEQQREAGPGALAVMIPVRPQGLPGGWRMSIAHASAAFIDPQGKVLHRQEPTQVTPLWARAGDGALEAQNTWLLPRTAFADLAGRARQVRIRYSVALLAPAHSAEIPVDGVRRDLAGLGHCAATRHGPVAIEVTCFKAGRQPDSLTARPAGSELFEGAAAGWPSFAPDPLQFSPGRRSTMTITHALARPVSRVVITAYEARAHVVREVALPTIRGGPACRPGDAPWPFQRSL